MTTVSAQAIVSCPATMIWDDSQRISTLFTPDNIPFEPLQPASRLPSQIPEVYYSVIHERSSDDSNLPSSYPSPPSSLAPAFCIPIIPSHQHLTRTPFSQKPTA